VKKANLSKGRDPNYVPKFSFGNFVGLFEAKGENTLAKKRQNFRALTLEKEKGSQLPQCEKNGSFSRRPTLSAERVSRPCEG